MNSHQPALSRITELSVIGAVSCSPMTNGLSSAICDATPRCLTTQQIGRLGELLVQYELLRYAIDSAPMTTDSGIDLVAYSGVKNCSITLQVKSNLTPKPGGGKGAPAVDWWVSEDCPAELYAFAAFQKFAPPLPGLQSSMP